MTVNRSSEELQMRELIVPRLREAWPSARIVHELPVRYSTNRIDLAAITEREIIGVEIKSSKDVADRLEAQLRAFLPICSRIIVALAPKWNEKLPMQKRQRRLKGYGDITSFSLQRTETQEIIHRCNASWIETWTVDADKGAIDVTAGSYGWNNMPWLSRMLDVLHVEELKAVAARHRISLGSRSTHRDILRECCDLMTGREIIAAVCAALRARDAFAQGTDAPIRQAA